MEQHGTRPDVVTGRKPGIRTDDCTPCAHQSVVRVASLPCGTVVTVLVAEPLYRVGGYRAALRATARRGLAAALAARRLGARMAARRADGSDARRAGTAAFWAVGLASPVTVYALDFWDHALGLGLMAWGVVVVLELLDETPQRWPETARRGLVAGIAVRPAATMRRRPSCLPPPPVSSSRERSSPVATGTDGPPGDLRALASIVSVRCSSEARRWTSHRRRIDCGPTGPCRRQGGRRPRCRRPCRAGLPQLVGDGAGAGACGVASRAATGRRDRGGRRPRRRDSAVAWRQGSLRWRRSSWGPASPIGSIRPRVGGRRALRRRGPRAGVGATGVNPRRPCSWP